MAIDSTAQPLRQVNAPLATEGANGLARLRVQADQIAVTGAQKDALIVTICPVGNAAMHEAIVGWRSVLPRLGVVDPLGLSCRGVDGRNLGERGTDIENAVNHERSRFPHPSFQMIRFRDLFLSGAPCPRGPQASEIVPPYLRKRRIFRTGLVASIVQPFRRRALNLLRLRMRGTADPQHRIRALSRLHDGSHSSQERCCDQGCPGYQSVTPARHRMYLLLIRIVTSIAHERSPYNYELCWLDIPTVAETSDYRNARLLSGSSATLT